MTYVMSDIHGCFEKYREMLAAIDFSSADTLYVLGDVLDRGPDGIRILQDMNVRPNVFPILGNHEFTAAVCLPWLLKEVTDQSIESLGDVQVAALGEWVVNGGTPTLRSLQKLTLEEREDILEYLQEMDLYAEVEAGGRSFVLVHAGIENFTPQRPLDSYQLSDFILGRLDGKKMYFADKFLVYGHTPVRLLRQQEGEPLSDKIYRRGNQIAIDCGCAFQGGLLGCLCLDTMEEFYV